MVTWQRQGRGQPSPEYSPMGLLVLLPIDDTGEQPKGLGTCRKGIVWRRWVGAGRKFCPAVRLRPFGFPHCPAPLH